MKFNCDEEFDLLEIYRKLTAKSTPVMVKACEFFDQPNTCDNLYKLQTLAQQILASSAEA